MVCLTQFNCCWFCNYKTWAVGPGMTKTFFFYGFDWFCLLGAVLAGMLLWQKGFYEGAKGEQLFFWIREKHFVWGKFRRKGKLKWLLAFKTSSKIHGSFCSVTLHLNLSGRWITYFSSSNVGIKILIKSFKFYLYFFLSLCLWNSSST